ncbi:PAAR domain-containing protein [Trabulsiella odontotermitis]|uniref:PAAR domain-containing protein n=1 Tax=Trabulsiella odontotermitis TaxID=379893 RepID=UPI0024B6E3C9|nr:PAAR domain-containing protein [Trabulsiella odontotermitis]WHP31495.1 PAAR domain-containing protein [Trabulsiella odontotermitis]
MPVKLKVITIGDKTTTGGIIESGALTVICHNRPVALIGSESFCPQCKTTGIIRKTKQFQVFAENKLVCLEGDIVECACPPGTNRVIASPNTFEFIGYENGMVGSSASNSLLCSEEQEPEQHAQAARRKAAPEPQQEEKTQKPRREITLTLGVFFDGTGNNAVNTANMLKVCTARHYNLNDAEAAGILEKCAEEEFSVSGTGATSYNGYYTNIHWLNTLYDKTVSADNSEIQQAIYIDGIGTDSGKPDSMAGLVFGTSDTGVIAKTDKSVAQISRTITNTIKQIKDKSSGCELVIKSLQFDIFGFSRGAAASRHFANRILAEDPAIISAIREGIGDITFTGAPAGKTRFIGIFDTVAAIGTPTNGLNPHTADTGEVNIKLHKGVADKVFHITAAHECRFNFALNSVKPAWPELVLPGVHSDLGGGYLPVVEENLFLTRPETETVPLRQPDQQTHCYHRAVKAMTALHTYPSIAPLLSGSEVAVETWYDDRMQPDRYSVPQKRSYAAVTLRNRTVRNDWSKVVLQVMLDAARDAGVLFKSVHEKSSELSLPGELVSLSEKARAMGRAARSGKTPDAFTSEELNIIAGQYLHCSANWNAIATDADGVIRGGAAPVEIISFVNRPDENWRRTIYNMDGEQI